MKQRLFAGALCVFFLFSVFPLFSQDVEELQETKETIKTAVVEEGVFRKDLFDRAMSGRLLSEVDAFTDEILNTYINERLQQGGAAVPELHEFLFQFYPAGKKAAILGNLARFGVFNAFSEDLLGHLENRLPESDAGESIVFAVESYKAMRLYKTTGEGLTGEQWKLIFSHLWQAFQVRPLQTNTEVLQEASRKSGRRRELFEVQAYDYYDKGSPGLLSRVRLFLRYLFAPGKEGGFRKELETVWKKLRRDIIAAAGRSTPENLPRLEDVRLYSFEKERVVLFSSTDESSPVHGKQLIMPFFSTTCPHCIVELQALGEIQDDLSGRAAETGDVENGPLEEIFIAAVNTNLQGIEIFKEKMHEFTARSGVDLNFYINIGEMNSLVPDYGIESVPMLLLFDERGSPRAKVQFQHLGHIKMKLGWVLEEYLDFTL